MIKIWIRESTVDFYIRHFAKDHNGYIFKFFYVKVNIHDFTSFTRNI